MGHFQSRGGVVRVAVVACALLAGISGGRAADLFVAPDGNDANPGAADRPFATLTRAMEAVRQARAAMKEHPAAVNVVLRGGVYRVTEPIKFTPADSGTADAPVTYAAAAGERVIFSGGVRLGGQWTRTADKPFWQLDVPEARDGRWIFNSLYVNGQSRTRARTPNHGQKEMRSEGPEPGGDARQSLRYLAGDVNPAWTNPTDIDVVLLCNWTPTLHRIKQIDAEKRVLRFFSAHTRRVDAFDSNPRYYLSNVFEALDEPGEWYLNRRTGVLYYYPMPGEDLSKAEIIAPVMKSRMIEFAGNLDGDRPVEHVHFRGLHFLHVDGDMDRFNGQYRQGHMFLDAAISAKGLRHASFEQCEFAQLGEYAMELADGCRDVTVRQCHFWDLGAGAIQLGVSDLPTLKTALTLNAKPGASVEPRREASELVIDNNCIHRLGTIWHGCYGIVNRFASLSKITHNEIFDTHWDAIGLDARWDWHGEKYSHGNEVAYNHLHHLGLRYHTDAGAIYQFGPLDTHIHHNRIHDTLAYPYACGFTGIYLDETSRGAVVENNLVYNVDWVAFFQNYGDNNVIRNNIAAFARDGFFNRGSVGAKRKLNYVEVTRNIYIARDGLALMREWEAGEKPPQVHDNRYYTIAKETALRFAGKTLEQWQAGGWDAGSSVGEPGCVNPAGFDFTLPADAPACKAIGFVPFNEEIAKAGLYGDDEWRKLPNAYPPRTPAAVWSQEELARFNAFSIDVNVLKVGEEPPVFRNNAEKGAGFAVTNEVAGVSGPKCIKCTDRKGMVKPFYPYLLMSPRYLKRGQITFNFAVMQPAQSAAALGVELRSGGQPYRTGPSVSISSSGAVRAGNREVCRLKPGAWTRFEMRFALGDASNGSYTLAVRDDGGEKTLTLPFVKAEFRDIGWIGITTPNDADGVCYLDDLRLKIDE